MKHWTIQHVVVAMIFILAGGDSSIVYAQQRPDVADVAQQMTLKPRQPGGFFKDQLGTYLSIEGVLYDGGGKVESNSLVVDTVDGKKLDKPLLIVVKNVRLPAKTRCVLKGYELGEMIGRPPAEYDLTKELGKDPQELARRDATVWRWRPYFVPLIAVEPQGLEVTTQWGITNR
jgi:hypothetical protein